MTRAEGRVSLRAIPLAGRVIHVDGRLDEDIYTQFEPASDFIQQEPKEGEPATERTEAWVFFDEKNVYVSARCLDSHPERMVANEMRRDHFNLFENENFAVIFDTFHDKRNGYMFYTTPIGGLFDGLVTDEGNTNRDWNTVWDAKPQHDGKGWKLVEPRTWERSVVRVETPDAVYLVAMTIVCHLQDGTLDVRGARAVEEGSALPIP